MPVENVDLKKWNKDIKFYTLYNWIIYLSKLEKIIFPMHYRGKTLATNNIVQPKSNFFYNNIKINFYET